MRMDAIEENDFASWEFDAGKQRWTWTGDGWKHLSGSNGEPLDYSGFLSLIHPADVSLLKEHLERSSGVGVGFSIEIRRRLSDGNFRNLTVKGQPASRIGAGWMLKGTLAEKPRRIQSGTTLADSEARYRTLFDLSPLGILWETRDGTIVDVNPAFCQSLGYRREELIGQKVEVLTHPDARALVPENISELSKGKILKHVEKSLRKDGSTCFMELHEKMIQLPDGQKGLLCVAEDISDRVAAEEERKNLITELKKALNKIKKQQSEIIQAGKLSALGRMVSGVAHEINNPLSFIHGNMEYLDAALEKLLNELAISKDNLQDGDLENARKVLQKYSTPRYKKEMLASVRSAYQGTQRIMDIVRNLQSFSNLQLPEFDELDVNEELRQMVDLFVSHHNVAVKTRFGKVPALRGNVVELNQCFTNILMNAVDAVQRAYRSGILPEDGGEISIETHAVKKAGTPSIVVTIQDNGVGIPSEIKDQIFEPFFTTKGVAEGQGLGLSEAYGVVTKHGGTLKFKSKKNEGSSFSITLPIRDQEAAG